jgi:hypothetical protein
MGRIGNLRTHLLGCDLVSKIGTHSSELSNHRFDLVGSAPVLAHLEFYTPPQSFFLVRSHRGLLKILGEGVGQQNAGQYARA